MPPARLLRAVRGLMIRPQAKAPTMRATRIVRSSGSIRTSANCAPNE